MADRAGDDDVELDSLTARVAVSQSLFTAGNTLTVGGFFNYFANSYRPTALWLAVLHSAPEFFETAAVFTRPLVMKWGSRKRLWMTGMILGRLAGLGIPLAALIWKPGVATIAPLLFILCCLGVWYVAQGLGYVAYLSWLSDLSPESKWGRFFASRQLAQVATTLFVFSAAALATSGIRERQNQTLTTTYFIGAFTIGGLVAITSILPMLRLPDVPARSADPRLAGFDGFSRALEEPNFRRFVCWSCHLSLAQGLTQAVLTKYQIEYLKIPLSWFLAMNSLMLLIQSGLSLVAGRISDRFGDRRALLISGLLVGTALLFALYATPKRWYLQFGVYAVCGLFGIVNVCNQTMALRLAPRSDNTLHLGLLRPISGLTAACAGLLGGAFYDLAATNVSSLIRDPFPFHIVFGVSIFGRLTAPFWLLGIREPTEAPSPNISPR